MYVMLYIVVCSLLSMHAQAANYYNYYYINEHDELFLCINFLDIYIWQSITINGDGRLIEDLQVFDARSKLA